MGNINHRVCCVGGTVCAASLLAGCSLASVGSPRGSPTIGPAVTVTQPGAPAALLIVTAGAASGPELSGLVASTARPKEDITILQAGTPATAIVASDSPGPTEITMAGPPLAPGGGQTAYQSAQYARKLKSWRSERAAATRAEAAETRERVSTWLSGLGISQKIGRLADPVRSAGSLAAESAAAANAMTGLAEEAGDVFGGRRVIVLFCDSLGDSLPAGELTGDDVIVVTRYLPTATAASAAQAELLEAGAAQAAVLGTEVTADQLTALVSADLSQGAAGDAVSTPLLFGNNSAALDAAAIIQLTRMLPRLREAGAAVMINGYASTPGTVAANYLLSYRRAAEVAGFLESHGIPESALIIVGHGATDVFGSGSPDANRRVLVVASRGASG